jgi:hypothetical protein
MPKIQALIVLELLGKPEAHVNEALNTLVAKLGSEKGIKILNKNLNKAIPVKDSNSLFTAFAEVDVELPTIEHLFGLLFAYMPAHIEIASPKELSFTNLELNTLANTLIQRLHDYDAITKRMIVERDYAYKKLYEIAPHLFKQTPQAQPPQEHQSQAPSKTSTKKPKSSKSKKTKKR